MTKNPTISHPSGGSTGDAQDWQQRSKAGAWRYNADMERLLALKESDPDRYDRLPVNAHLNVGYYASAKAAAKEVGANTNPPKDAA